MAPIKDLGHGPRLTHLEYMERVTALYRDAPLMPTREQDLELMRAELELTIDCRLGREFPQILRKFMWMNRRNLERYRLPIAAMSFLKAMVGLHPHGTLDPQLVGWFYRNTLLPDELKAFLGLGDSTP